MQFAGRVQGRTRHPARVASLLVCAVLLSGCVAGQPQGHGAKPSRQPDAPALVSQTVRPGDFLSVVAGADPAANAIATSRALYERADLVVTAPAGDAPAQLLAASAAVALGAPLLLTPATPAGGASPADPPSKNAQDAPNAAAAAALEGELTRLGAATVLDVGGDAASAAAEQGGQAPREVVSVAATAAAVNAVLPRPLETRPAPSAGGALAAVAGLRPGSPVLLGPAELPTPTRTPAPDAARTRLPRVHRSAPLAGGLMLAADDPAQLAGAATARSAGVEVQLVPAGRPNPQASSALVKMLAAARPAFVLALGAPFAREASLGWKIRSAITGAQLPGGGQLLFPRHLFVALYGTPGAPVLGVLGEQGLTASVARAKRMAAPYQAFTDRQVVPMFEIIATVAAGSAGSDGNYSNEISAASLRPWVTAAAAAGAYVVLDLQPGLTDFLSQAKRYESLLEFPNVGLALDPEWRLKPGQRHLAQIGSVPVAEVNSVVTWLADLTARHALPQKLLVLHQFQLRMIGNRAALDTSHPELAVLIHVDGLGSQPAKQATWSALHADAPAAVAWGWKNFIDEDRPMLTVEQTMRQVRPTPDLVTYQ
jgi:hypothetical protein